MRGSPVVTADETSWRVDADLQWLWAFVTPQTTVYAIQPGRGLAQAAVDRPGLSRCAGARWLAVVSAVYARAASDLSRASAARVSRACCSISRAPVGHAASKRSSRRRSPRARAIRGPVSGHGLAVARGHYSSGSAGSSRGRRVAISRVRRFQQHLIVEFDAIFSFLFDPTLDAANWWAEQALRPAVVTRKMCGGGNRTARGARSQEVLARCVPHRPPARA